MADLYTTSTGLSGNYATVGGNAKKLLGDGASGVGPYTSFGTPKLQAIKVVSATIDFTTTPTIVNSNLSKAVSGLQNLAEVYYVGKPTASGANQFVALINTNKTDSGDGYGASTSFDGSYENLEDSIGAALGVAENDITITEVALTGLTFA